jgi:hypothetical protein
MFLGYRRCPGTKVAFPDNSTHSIMEATPCSFKFVIGYAATFPAAIFPSIWQGFEEHFLKSVYLNILTAHLQ